MTKEEGYRIALEQIANFQYNDYGETSDWAGSIAHVALAQTYEYELDLEKKVRLKKEKEYDDYDDENDYDFNDTNFTF